MSVREGKTPRRDFLRAGTAAAIGAALVRGTSASVASGNDTSGGGYIDAHVHVWSADTARYPLKPGFPKENLRAPSFTPEELFAHTRPCGVSRVVLIQVSYYGYDNSYMLDVIRNHPGVFSGVALIDPADRPREKMQELARYGIRGFRIGAGGRSRDRWLEGEGMATMWAVGAEKGLAMCPLINPEHLPALGDMCGHFPATPVVIDHLARIGIDGMFRDADIDMLCGLARHTNVNVKISAFSALGAKKAPYHDLAPLIRRVLDAFGAERLMWATDGPWQMMGGHTYRDSIDLIRSGLDFLSDEDRRCLLRTTAEKLFFRPA